MQVWELDFDVSGSVSQIDLTFSQADLADGGCQRDVTREAKFLVEVSSALARGKSIRIDSVIDHLASLVAKSLIDMKISSRLRDSHNCCQRIQVADGFGLELHDVANVPCGWNFE